MKWFRRFSVGASPQQEAAQTPACAGLPSPSFADAVPILPPDSPLTSLESSSDAALYVSEAGPSPSDYDSDQETLSNTPARGVKRPANDNLMEVDVEDTDFEYNSSGVCPKDSVSAPPSPIPHPANILHDRNKSEQRAEFSQARHNQRVTKRPPIEHLLHLPASIQRRVYSFVLLSDTPYQVAPDGKILPKPVIYWKIRDDHSLTKKELKKHNGTAICKPPGLLTICKQIRKLALDVFYVGNDFEVQVSKFHGEGILKCWERVCAVRKKCYTQPIMLAGGLPGPSLSENLGTIPVDELRTSLRSAVGRAITHRWYWNSRYYAMHHFDPRLTRLPEGKIELEVTYEPDWNNLVTWLNLCIMGRLPAYNPSNLDCEPLGTRLQTVAWLFAIVDQYSKEEWQAFDKTIDTHREHLIRDDPRWAGEDYRSRVFGEPRASDLALAGRAASFTSSISSTSAHSSDQGSSPISHTMSRKILDRDTLGPSVSAWHAQAVGTSSDDYKLYDSECDEEELFGAGEERDDDDVPQHDAETSDIVPDCVIDEMNLDDGHRHKRRRFSAGVEDSGDEWDSE